MRWYGGKDDGLVNVLSDVRLWGMQCEIERHAEFSTANPGKSALEIREMVLSEDWPLKCKRSCMKSEEKNMTGCIKNRMESDNPTVLAEADCYM